MSVTVIVVLLVTGFLNVEGQRYDQCSELKRCEQEVDKFINLSNRLASYECRELIKNLNCLIKSINCMREEERQNLGTKIQRARSQHKTSCDGDEWDKRSSCFDGNEIRRCEEEFPRRLIHSNRENCMKYERFESCVSSAMGRSCRGDDNDYTQLYLLDIARDLPWQCPQYSSSYSPSSTSSWPTSGRGPYNNTGTFNEDICCRNERCNRNRLYQCRDDLKQVVDSRDSYNQDQRNLCWSYLNKFNCFLWHNYQCADKYDKDKDLLSNAKDAIERRCDAKGDIQRSQCFSSIEVRDCERRLDESNRHGEPSCRDFRMFYDCMERNMRRCNTGDELLFGFYLVNKVHHRAWTCSYNDNDSQFPGGTDSSQTYPEDETCESLVRQNYRHCDEKLQKNEEEARNTPSTRDRHVKSCCSALTFRECVRQVVRQQCRRENSMIVESLMGSSLRYRIPTCDDVNYSTCSGTRVLCNMLFMIAALITSRIYFKW